MSVEQSGLPMSPSLSATPTLSSTQAPTSIKDSLPDYGISLIDADKWNLEYNRQSLPLMQEHLFWRLLRDIASDTDPAGVESRIKSRMEQKSADSRAAFNTTRFEIMLSGPALFRRESEKMYFISALAEEHTVCGFEDFITHCAPPLIRMSLEAKLERSRRSTTSPKQKKSTPHRVSKSSAQPVGVKDRRRSLRIIERNTKLT